MSPLTTTIIGLALDLSSGLLYRCFYLSIVVVAHINKTAQQLSLEKKRYSLYSSCCSTDLPDHPRL